PCGRLAPYGNHPHGRRSATRRRRPPRPRPWHPQPDGGRKLGLPDRGVRHADDDHRGAGTAAGGSPEGGHGVSRGRTMSRRRFLLLSAAFGASCVTGLAPLPASAGPRAAVPPADRLLGLVRDRSSAGVVAAAYPALVPSPAHRDRP